MTCLLFEKIFDKRPLHPSNTIQDLAQWILYSKFCTPTQHTSPYNTTSLAIVEMNTMTMQLLFTSLSLAHQILQLEEVMAENDREHVFNSI